MGHKEFLGNPTSRDWRTLIIGLSLVPSMMLAVAVWTGLTGPGSLTFGGATLGLAGTEAEFGRGLSR